MTDKKLNILVIDDSLIIRNAIRNYLSEYESINVDTASNGHDALIKVKKYVPEIVTLDINLPGIDGFGILKQLKKICPSAKVYIVTALNDKATAIRALKSGATDILIKPFSANSFLKKVLPINYFTLNGIKQ